jgi:hypothetical protein
MEESWMPKSAVAESYTNPVVFFFVAILSVQWPQEIQHL